MKRSEALTKYRDMLEEEIVSSYKEVLSRRGRVQHDIYVWEDGEIETLVEPQGSNSWLQPKEWVDKKLFHVTTVEAPFFDPWDWIDEEKPEDEDEAEKKEKEIIEWLTEDYAGNVRKIIDDEMWKARKMESCQDYF